MNTYNELGSEWMGRVQLCFSAYEESNPKSLKKKLEKTTDILKIAERCIYEEFELRAEIFYAVNLPAKNGTKYKIMIQWGE